MTIICHQLCAGFANQKILHELNFTLSMQGITLIAGANGTGKSLLLHVLAGLHPPMQGTITFPKTLPKKTPEKPPALSMQTPILLERTVLKNLLFALQAEGIAKNDGYDLANLALSQLKIEKLRHQHVKTLSGGEKRLLAFARILVLNRQIWLLDEPTAMLAPKATELCETLIQSAKTSGKKIIMVTHEISQIKRLATKPTDDILFLRYNHQSLSQAWQKPAADFLLNLDSY